MSDTWDEVEAAHEARVREVEADLEQRVDALVVLELSRRMLEHQERELDRAVSAALAASRRASHARRAARRAVRLARRAGQLCRRLGVTPLVRPGEEEVLRQAGQRLGQRIEVSHAGE
jgi:hypothetical protein